MKKVLCVLALSGFLFACNNDKTEEKKTEETTTTQPSGDATTPADQPADPAPTTTTADPELPTFSDPEVQKFAADYAAFIKEYKAAAGNPAKLAELGKNMQDWSTRGQAIGMKLAQKPEEAQKWAQWWLAVSKDLYPTSTAK